MPLSQTKPVVWVPVSSDTALVNRMIEGVAKYRNHHQDWALTYPTRFYPRPVPPEVIGAFLWRSNAKEHRHLSAQVPCVQLSNTKPTPEIPLVSSDDTMVGALAADHFISKRFKTFAFLGPFDTTYTQMRFDGFQQKIKQTHPDSSVEKFDFKSQKSFLQSGGVKVIFRHLRKLPPPWALFCADDWWAKCVLEQCPAYSISVPGELSVLGVNNEAHVCEISNPPVSSIEIPSEEIGYEAARLLDRMIHGESNLPMTIRVPVHRVVTRQSTDITAVSDPVVSRALSFMQGNVNKEDLTVEAIARASGVSRRVLERRFANELNVSPYKHLLQFRVDQAKSLLRATHWPLHRIAVVCGFAEQKYLSIRFKKLEGVSPLQWRKTHTRL